MMKYIPKSVTRYAGKTSLKFAKHGPTGMVIAGVVGLGASAVMAAVATRKIDPVIDQHRKDRIFIAENGSIEKKENQRELARLYSRTTIDLAKIYAPAIAIGTLSACSVLYGHRVLQGRHVATIAAYAGLNERFEAYRGRVAKTLGADVERGIYEGAHGEWIEDPDHKGEHKLAPVWDPTEASYLRPWFEVGNPNWTGHAQSNEMFLTGAQNHLNNLLYSRGHVFLNEVLDVLGMPRTKEGQAAGWLHSRVHPDATGDDFVDLGFMTGRDPHTVAFRQSEANTVQLNFNIDGVIWEKI